MLRPFLLDEPGTVAEASALLARYEDATRVYAGGTELLLAMKEGFLRYERLINIKQIPGLDGVTLDEGRRLLRIGPLTTHRALSRAPIVRERLPELAEVEDHVGNIRVRTVGTLGGNLCFAEPHADPGTFLLLCDAEITLARAAGQRTLPLQQFITGPYETALEPDEVLTEIRVPLLPPNGAIAYRKFGFLERPSIGVGVAVIGSGRNGGLEAVRIAVGCAGPTPRRVPEAEVRLQGRSAEEAVGHLGEAAEIAGRAAEAVDDLHGSAEYKTHMVGVLLRRVFHEALENLR